MKSKLGTYLLIAALASIWGTIIYKMVNGINPDAPELILNQPNGAFNPKPIALTESFTISDVERDPFLGTLRHVNKPKIKNAKKSINSEPINTPQINFSGIVKNGKDQVFILTINGKQHLMRKGQTINEVKLISGTSKQIMVRFNKVNSTILVD